MSNNPYKSGLSGQPNGQYYVTEPDGAGREGRVEEQFDDDGEYEEDEEEYEEEEEDEEEEYDDGTEDGRQGMPTDYYQPDRPQEARTTGSGFRNPYDNPTTFEPREPGRRGSLNANGSTSFPESSGAGTGHNQRISGINVKTQRSKSMIPGRDWLDSLFTHVDTDLAMCKAFYFFFFAAFGSLFPLLGIYLKQIGFNPKQVGIVIGFRPFVEMCGAPLWGTIAERYQRAKHILLLSLVCWIVFTLSLAFVSPKPAGCVIFNDTHRFFEPTIFTKSVKDEKEETLAVVQKGEGNIVIPEAGLLRYDHARIGPLTLNAMKNGEARTGRKKVMVKRDISLKDFFDIKRKGHKLPKGYVIGKSPIVISPDWLENYPETVKVLVKPTFSNVIFDEKEVQRSFLIFLMLMVVGEFFAAPSLPLADSATLGYLGLDSNNYGKQRMFGSLGWGLSMFFVGVALDQSTSFPDHPCGVHDPGEKNYTICFAVFSVLMSLAFIAASQFYFKYQSEEDFIQMKDLEDESRELDYYKKGLNLNLSGQDPYETYDRQTVTKTYSVADNSKVTASALPDDFEDNFAPKTTSTAVENRNFNFQNDNSHGGRGRGSDGQVPPRPPRPVAPGMGTSDGQRAVPVPRKSGDSKYKDTTTPRIFRQNELKANLPEWMKALKTFKTPYHASFLFISFYMGLGMGFVFTFLFWHLQDVGGSPTVFGIASIINHLSELVAYLFSVRLMTQLGHIKILYLGLMANTLRFLYISWLKNPWWVLPFEFLQGLTHAAVWVACCSFVTQTTPPHLRSSAQAILQTLHHGLGRGFGSVFGGFLIHYCGSRKVFRAYGFISALLLVGFFLMNKYFGKKQPFPTIQSEQIHEEQLHLDPHGLPFNPISRDISRNRLSEYREPGETSNRPTNLTGPNSNYNMNRLIPGY